MWMPKVGAVTAEMTSRGRPPRVGLRFVALTGTPGTGKSAVGRALRDRYGSVELAEIALKAGAGRRVGRSTEVDLRRLAGYLSHVPLPAGTWLLVGHLAHLLPVSAVVVLRCNPLELAERLRAARRGTRQERGENFVSEATDLILLEAIATGRSVWEVDTTGRSIRTVADDVARRIRAGGRSRFGRVDWLSDQKVTKSLLRPPT